MIDVIKFINVRAVADRIMRHPLLLSVLLESIVSYTVDFLRIWGFESLYIRKQDVIHVNEYRAVLPCGLIRINALRDKHGTVLKEMSGYFNNKLENPAYKIQGQLLYTNIKEGDFDIVYDVMPIDDDGYPLVLDHPVFLRALEAFIKCEIFSIYFDLGKIQGAILDNAQREYAWRAGQLNGMVSLPSMAEMQSISNMWNKMHLTTKDFYNGFQTAGNIDTYKIH